MKTFCIYLLMAVSVFGQLPADWKNVQRFEVAQTGLINLSLPAETLDAARPGLEDLRILDGAGREVPYLIDRPSRSSVAMFSPKKFGVNLSGQSTLILLETGSARPIDAVILETPAVGFIKAVRVEGSNDQQTWQLLASGQPIFPSTERRKAIAGGVSARSLVILAPDRG
jgi:hypothetical protein